MGNSNGIISAPISLHADVYPVLGISAQNGLYDLGYVCKNGHGRINPWAKYKPVCHLSPGGDRATICKAQYSSTADLEYYHANGDYGLSPEYKTVLPTVNTEILAAVKEACLHGWHYQPPTGGNYWYRLTDFEGYDRSAEPSLCSTSPQSRSVNPAVTERVIFSFSFFEKGENSGWVCVDDLTGASELDLKKCRIVGVIERNNGAFLQMAYSDYILNSNGNLNSGGTYVQFSLSNYGDGTWYPDCKVYFALVQDGDGGQGSSHVYSLPKDSGYSTLPLTLGILYNAGAAGVICKNWDTDVFISPREMSAGLVKEPNIQLMYCSSDGDTLRAYMSNYDGSISFRIKFTNDTEKSYTYTKDNFVIDTGNVQKKSATRMYSDDGQEIESFTVNADGTYWVWLCFISGTLPNVQPGSNEYVNRTLGSEVTLYRYDEETNNYSSVFGEPFKLYHHYGEVGITQYL